QKDGSAWYSNPAYSRYWRHYQQAMNWHHRHHQAYKKALEAVYCSPFPAWDPGMSRRYADWNEGESTPQRPPAREPGRRGPQHTAHTRRSQAMEGKGETDSEEDSSSDSEIECDVSDMEISEELRQYFAQTERHREELKKQQQMEAEQQDAYVLADHDLHRVGGRSVQPPVERPGERRMIEMKKLYGEDAAKIQGMETAMQLTFDRNCDKKQPKYWPVIALKL
ncbi:GEMI8 protein, partial [Amia calva]|nr:GEMI8 protein [Amia calva]